VEAKGRRGEGEEMMKREVGASGIGRERGERERGVREGRMEKITGGGEKGWWGD